MESQLKYNKCKKCNKNCVDEYCYRHKKTSKTPKMDEVVLPVIEIVEVPKAIKGLTRCNFEGCTKGARLPNTLCYKHKMMELKKNKD
jgi:hypothetical protein